MTCKDCFHFKVCEYEGVYFEDVAIEASSADGIEDLCPMFENKVDFVEVVLCEGCKHWEFVSEEPIYKRKLGNCKCPNWENDDFWCQTWEDDFCSYGERRDKE